MKEQNNGPVLLPIRLTAETGLSLSELLISGRQRWNRGSETRTDYDVDGLFRLYFEQTSLPIIA